MAEIVIVNERTIRRRLRNLGIAALAVGLLYASQPVFQKVATKYDNWKAYSSVKVAVIDNSYTKANQLLDSFRGKFSQEQISELEARIQSVHPDRVVEEVQKTQDYEKRIELLRKAYQEYHSLGQERLGLKEQYLQAHLTYLTLQLQSTKPNSEQINQGFDALLADDIILKRDKSGIYRTVKVESGLLDALFNAEVVYIRHFTGSAHKLIDPVLTKSIQLAEELVPEKKQVYVAQTLEAYGKQIKGFLPDSNINVSSKLNSLSSLKKLERLYAHKVSALDVDAAIIAYISK